MEVLLSGGAVESGEVLLDSDHGATPRAQLVAAALIAIDPDEQLSTPNFELGFATGEAPGNRVPVPPIRHEALATDVPSLGHHDLVGSAPGHRVQLLLIELSDRDHAGRGVDPFSVDGSCTTAGPGG